MLIIAITLHNFPEGLAVGVGLGSGYLPETIAGVFGVVAVTLMRPLLPWGLAFAVGDMLYVVSDEITPETHPRGFEFEGK